MNMRSAIGRLLLFGTLLTAASRGTRADEAYFMIVFGSETTPKVLKYTHTWITYVRVVGQGCDPAGWSVASAHTISWLPATLNVRVFAPHPEPGVNLDLYRTLDFVLSTGQSVDVWAPMRVGPELYQVSVDQWHRLERGEALYQAIDPRRLGIHDCIHANTDLDPQFGQGHYPLIRIGKPASAYIVKQIGLRGQYFSPYEDTTWIISALGIDRYPVRVIRPAVVR
jgi:hypothetical protein